jgi:hypothetical protein
MEWLGSALSGSADRVRPALFRNTDRLPSALSRNKDRLRSALIRNGDRLESALMGRADRLRSALSHRSFPNIWAKAGNENRLNQLVLLLNQTVTFDEVSNVKDTVGSVILSAFVVAVLGMILWLIFSKDQVRPASRASNKARVLDCGDIHKPEARSSSTPPRRSPPSKLTYSKSCRLRIQPKVDFPRL